MSHDPMDHNTLNSPETRETATGLFQALTDSLPATVSATAMILAAAALLKYVAEAAGMDPSAAYNQAADSLGRDEDFDPDLTPVVTDNHLPN